MTLQDTIQLSIAEQKSHEVFKAQQNAGKVNEHLVVEDIEKMVEGTENIKGRYDYLFGHRRTAFMPRKSFHELANHLQEVMQESIHSMVDSQVKEVTKTTVPVYVAVGLILERKKTQAIVAQIAADAIQKECENLRAEITLQINNDISNHIPSQADKYATDDGELPTENVSQELMKEMSKTVYEAKLRRVVDEILRQRCTSGDEHQYHNNQMQNFLKNDIVCESRLEILSLLSPQKPIPVDLRSLCCYYISFLRLSFLMTILKKELPDGRANGSMVSITEPGYKNLNKNDIEDTYLLCINGKVDDYAKTGLLWSLSVFIRSKVMVDHIGQVVYVLDQVVALEEELLLRIKQQGLIYKPQILVVTRLLPDATGTKCNQEMEPLLNTKHSHILIVPFRTEKGILR
uniref:sucrose synthase n=1 Tax=Tanacetum cinerariifolium TaxID=118510 RepID=A0A6L2M7A3_TANCI|nr:sucrose synthase 7-like [Tanacetum cinerariifolium]